MSKLNKFNDARRIAYGDSDPEAVDVTPSTPLPVTEILPSTTPLSYYNSVALENDGVIKASAGVLYGVDGFSQVDGFFQVFDSATVPADTTIPTHSQPVGINEAFSYDPPEGVVYSTGISFALSSTVITKTLIVTDEIVAYGYYL